MALLQNVSFKYFTKNHICQNTPKTSGFSFNCFVEICTYFLLGSFRKLNLVNSSISLSNETVLCKYAEYAISVIKISLRI